MIASRKHLSPMASESSLWGVVKQLLVGLDPHRVENKLEKGMPDVNFTGGWIELKHADKWNQSGELNLQNTVDYKKEQRIWLRRRWLAAKGGAFLLLRVGKELYLFDGVTAFGLPNSLSRRYAVQHCLRCWTNKPTIGVFQSCILTNKRNSSSGVEEKDTPSERQHLN